MFPHQTVFIVCTLFFLHNLSKNAIQKLWLNKFLIIFLHSNILPPKKMICLYQFTYFCIVWGVIKSRNNSLISVEIIFKLFVCKNCNIAIVVTSCFYTNQSFPWRTHANYIFKAITFLSDENLIIYKWNLNFQMLLKMARIYNNLSILLIFVQF